MDALCNITNISPKIKVKKTYSRAPKTKKTVAALAATYGVAVEQEAIKQRASITPTRQKRKRDTMKLDIESEVQMLQAYFKDVDAMELAEDVHNSTPRKSATPSSTRAPWLTPEEKPRGKHAHVHAEEWLTPQKQVMRAHAHDDKENVDANVRGRTPQQACASPAPTQNPVFATPDKPARKALFATPDQKPRKKTQRAQETVQKVTESEPVTQKALATQPAQDSAQKAQDNTQAPQLRRSGRARRADSDTAKLRRVR